MNYRKLTVVMLIGVILLISVGATMALIGSKKDAKPKPMPQNKRAVKVEEVNYKEISTQVSSLGRIVSHKNVDVIAEVSGKIMQGTVPLKKGQTFKKGQVLATIYSRDFDYSLKSRKSNFLRLIAGILPDIKIDYPGSYQKWSDFFESVDISGTLPELPGAGSQQEKLFLANRQVLSEYYGIRSSEETLKKYTIVAPFDGSITMVMLEAGSVANPGSRLAKIIKTGDLEMEVPVKSNEAEWINVGDLSTITAENGKEIAHGRVVRKSNFIDPSTQSLSVFVGITDNGTKLFEGQYYYAVFPNKKVAQAMEMPRNAVFNSDEVFIYDNGYLQKQTIDVLKENERTLIFSGLEEGLQLVVEPLVNVKEGTEVIISKN
ncbi:MAG: efflux RND transporter periplasmic adaptor subunit [Bacteroidales bacterium]|nr:efflux RND transporter periplasmic adaptor subunit [Bacteroidales bacterium]